MEYYVYIRVAKSGALKVSRRIFASPEQVLRLVERYNRLHRSRKILSVQNALTERSVWREPLRQPA